MRRDPSLRERALRLLARREHSRAELLRKLAPHAASAEELEALLAELAGKRQLSEERYAEERARTLSRKYGAARILHELKAKGVDGALAVRTAQAARANELERAREVWRKKFGSPADSREGRARQMRFLQSRGFSFDVIRTVLGGDEGAD